MKIEYIDTNKLKEHEEVIDEHLDCICDEIATNKWVKPLLVDKDSSIILDGHHRFNALKKLKVDKIPIIFVDYLDDDIVELTAWRENEIYTKLDVIEMVRSGKKYIPKTTRHTIKFNSELMEAKISIQELF